MRPSPYANLAAHRPELLLGAAGHRPQIQRVAIVRTPTERPHAPQRQLRQLAGRRYRYCSTGTSLYR
jgi:hypothetical protein